MAACGSPAKAALAQHLLARAWDEARAGGTEPRPWSWADTHSVARLTVPNLGIDQLVLAGASGRVMAFGPGHHPGTAPPGASGNTVISGHRDTYFAFLADLRTGDRIALESADGKQRNFRVIDFGCIARLLSARLLAVVEARQWRHHTTGQLGAPP